MERMKKQYKQEIRFRNPDYVMPPGCLEDSVPHPVFHEQRLVDVALFNDHRYAFFFWANWYHKLKEKAIVVDTPPSLISLDWHQDLAGPLDNQKKQLKELDTTNNIDLSLYAWSSLSHINDEQILSAMYLNLIGDLYLYCRQRSSSSDSWTYTDMFGNKHKIKIFRTFESLEDHLVKKLLSNVFFDIDLDFFVEHSPYSTGGSKSVKKFTYISDTEIKSMLDPQRPLFKWAFERLCGVTIAIEPEHSGGLKRALKYLNMFDRAFFHPSLFTNCGSNYDNNASWRHLAESRS